jgi:tyrosyl-tRNA synthetase
VSGSGLPTFEVALPIKIVDALVLTGLAKSKREARQFIKDGAVRVNGVKVEVGDE